MNREEAINWIKLARLPYHNDDARVEAINMAIADMEKQIPKKVKEIHVDEYYCPNCSAELNCNDGQVQDKYCSECGQKFEVGEENNE